MASTMQAQSSPGPYQDPYQSPEQYGQPSARPRAVSGFSIHSNSTNKTKTKPDSAESHEEKAHIKGKANPNAAMNEMQPVATALEKPTLASLRSASYNDQFGNPIAEPDRSNPTRARWERPLDTIRAFEAAIDNEYRARAAQARNGPADAQSDTGYNGGFNSRRSSSYWGGGYDSARPQRNSNYGGSQYGGNYAGNRDSYHENQQRQSLRPQQRQASDPQLSRYNSGPYAGGPVQPHSRDTVATGSGSASGSEPWATGTDPTGSENSSIDKVPRDDYSSGYGNGNPANNGQYRGGAPIAEDGPYGYTSYGGGANNYFSAHDSPAPPPHAVLPRKIISLSSSSNATADSVPYQVSGGNTTPRPTLESQDSGKRKSWLKRRFSGRN